MFNATPESLAKLYREIGSDFNVPGFPPHFTDRNFFESADEDFRQTYAESPVIATDLPSLMELDDGREDKPTVAFIGQDSKSNQPYEDLVVGTPYGLHHEGSREKLSNTKLYFKMIKVLLELSYRVYLTDLLKVWVCDPGRHDFKTQKGYRGMRLPKADQQKFRQLIEPELAVVKPEAIVTWGNVARDAVSKLQLDTQHLKFIHPSGANNRKWSKLLNQSPTHLAKLEYWRETIEREICR
ncbi:MAG: uracil-DNA glycosylase family protein [Cyanobacteria bacterium P01_A01_bin.17]